ncbi:DUF805 domain-containing protein [Akkermansiaceae bacterium]|nr:DUF805 domain-containing protein [Akkermansiaceae bacterium]MDB2429121.1 DUF805 domain-containing protein [Akkermansiaceae bacterium]MDB4731182.1 DUF805 domain-containing protein [Akkermansiaceae bacterium]
MEKEGENVPDRATNKTVLPEKMSAIRKYFHWKGCFSRSDLLIAHVIVVALVSSVGLTIDGVGYRALKNHAWIHLLGLLMVPALIFYVVAVGKRFRDIGCSAWMGVLALLVPIISLVLLFHKGAGNKTGEQVSAGNPLDAQ